MRLAASNSNAKQDDSVSKSVTAVESLSSQLTSLKQDFQNLKKKNVNSRNRGFMRQTYTKCNFCTSKMLINVHIVTYVAQTVTMQEDVYQNQTRATVDDW